ncbi:MAG: hypothetical protein QNJ23_10660 [Woeseiaceae bacterium]|nr:hypothetical protein [Woeseiaceae bacterium]
MPRLYLVLITLLVPFATQAGVVLDIVTKDMAGKEQERSQIYAQDGFLRLDSDGGPFAADVSLIFDGSRFLVIDHGEKTYIIMDEAMLTRMTDKMNEAMEQMKAQLANMPPEQRALAEQMMQSQMGGMMGDSVPSPPPRVEVTGNGEYGGRACTMYDVYENNIKTQEICSAPLDKVEGAAEMMATFRGMAKFVKKLSESLPGPLGSSFNEHPGMVAELINGFPIHTVEFRMGKPDSEIVMEVIREEPLAAAKFKAPDGYQLQDPFGGR